MNDALTTAARTKDEPAVAEIDEKAPAVPEPTENGTITFEEKVVATMGDGIEDRTVGGTRDRPKNRRANRGKAMQTRWQMVQLRLERENENWTVGKELLRSVNHLKKTKTKRKMMDLSMM